MNILITGATGFIGSNLIKFLRKKNENVVGLSRHGSHDKKIYSLSLCQRLALEKFVKKHKCDVVIHLAAQLNEKNPNIIFKENCHNTKNLLDCCIKNGVKRFIFASTHLVYAKSQYLPIDEYHKVNPLTNYAMSKLISENMCKTYSTLYELETIILRISSVYGMGQPNKYIIPTMIKNYLKKKLVVHKYRNGYQLMDLIHISDVCKALELCYKSKKLGIFNIASGKPLTSLDIAKKFLKLDSNIKIITKNIPKETNHFFYNIQKAEKELKFKPSIKISKKIIQECFNDLIDRKIIKQ